MALGLEDVETAGLVAKSDGGQGSWTYPALETQDDVTAFTSIHASLRVCCSASALRRVLGACPVQCTPEWSEGSMC